MRLLFRALFFPFFFFSNLYPVSSPDFILAVLMSKCGAQYFCSSSTFSIAMLNGTCFHYPATVIGIVSEVVIIIIIIIYIVRSEKF